MSCAIVCAAAGDGRRNGTRRGRSDSVRQGLGEASQARGDGTKTRGAYDAGAADGSTLLNLWSADTEVGFLLSRGAIRAQGSAGTQNKIQ